MTMKENSGSRGVVFDYPEQKTSDLPNPIVYPYCVQVQGKDVYIVNVGIRAAIKVSIYLHTNAITIISIIFRDIR